MLKAGFILLAVLLAAVLYIGAGIVTGKAFTRVSEEKQFKTKAVVVILVWLIYISVLSVKGIFAIATFPPRIPLLLVLPPFLFFAYLFTNRSFKKIIQNTPASWPVYFQSFRIIVELLLLGLATQNMLPKMATFEGYNYDIVIGITALLMGFFIRDTRFSQRLLLGWNIAGLCTLAIVAFILIGHSYFYTLFGQNESIVGKGFGLFPYTFLAGFFMPIAVFMHIFSIVQTRAAMKL